MGRDSVSHYVRGINLPTPAHLWALAKALGCEPYDLVPSMGMPSVDDKRKPAMRVDTLESGRAPIVMDRVVSLATALKIQQAVLEDDELCTNSGTRTHSPAGLPSHGSLATEGRATVEWFGQTKTRQESQ